MAGYHFREAPGSTADAPLFLVFHGTGGDENQFFDLAKQLLPGVHVVAPRGDVSEGGALRFFRRTAEGIYDMDDLRARTGAMAHFVREQIAQGGRRPVVGLGYSNGANILASVQFAAPELFDHTVLMHPLIPFTPAMAELDGKRVLITAGRQDPIAPASMTERLAAFLEGQGAQTTLFWHDGGHELRPAELQQVQSFLAPLRQSA